MSQIENLEPRLTRNGALTNRTIDDIVTECDAECCAGIEIINNHPFIELNCVHQYIVGGKISKFPLPNVPPNTMNAVLFESTEKGRGSSGMILFEINYLVTCETGENERINEGLKLALAWITPGRGFDNEIAMAIDEDVTCGQQWFESLMYGRLEYWFKRQTARDPPIFLQNLTNNSFFTSRGIMTTGNKSIIFITFS